MFSNNAAKFAKKRESILGQFTTVFNSLKLVNVEIDTAINKSAARVVKIQEQLQEESSEQHWLKEQQTNNSKTMSRMEEFI